jgi:hypothetical protein
VDRAGRTQCRRPPVVSDQTAEGVSISGDVLIATSRRNDEGGSSAGAAYIFSRSGTTWSQRPKLVASDPAVNNEFGYSVAIDSNVAIVGAQSGDSGVTDSGTAYISVEHRACRLV